MPQTRHQRLQQQKYRYYSITHCCITCIKSSALRLASCIRSAFAKLQTRPACASFVPTVPKSLSLAHQLRDFSLNPSIAVHKLNAYRFDNQNAPISSSRQAAFFRAQPPALSHKRYRDRASGSVMPITSDRHLPDTLHDLSTKHEPE